MLDVSSINAIENILLSETTQGFAALTHYAEHLLYYFIAFEIIFSGLSWAFYQSQYAERLFFQFLKIGLILFVVENYTDLLNGLLSSVNILGQQLTGTHTEKFLLNPGLIWQYGYNFSVSLLQTAASSDGFALPMIFMVMGFGILLLVGLFGIQICVQVLAFYVVAAMSLLMIPLSVFSPLRDFFSQSLKNLLQAAVRLMVQMLIVSAAISVWSVMSLQRFSPDMNINVPLGFLFTGLLFVFASAYLPRFAERIVGSIQWQTTISLASPAVTVSTAMPASFTASSALGRAEAGLPAALAPPGLAAALQTTSPTTAAASPAAAAAYMNAIKEDFSKKAGASGMTSFLTSKQWLEKERQHREEVLKIKQAFLEALREIKL